ncbi:hypothetical protein L1049_011671 [Liquidambar formosana]|uniref:Uncharacterized protein n=1 Tax=Liquidambar formosana TaxID=63359 RepID=A0AAP0RXJ4_LIQFO
MQPSLPKDVKGGHFAVMAIDNGNPKRFVVHLRYLNYPAFLTLLEQAAKEFGFDQEGIHFYFILLSVLWLIATPKDPPELSHLE